MVLEDLLKKEYDNYKEILDGYKEKRYVTLRVNTIKSNMDEIEDIFNSSDIEYEKVNFYKDALIIKNKDEKDLLDLDVYKAGKVYLQSLSSMIPPLYLEPKENESILDMTAAPGSKTSEIAALSNNTSLITAVEKDKYRCERLKYNLDKLGVRKVNVLNKDANSLDELYSFDKILLDAPCSGSGTLTIDTIDNFTEELLNKSVQRQTKLINKAIKLLKKDGILIYSTCSVLKEENEEIINKVLETKEVELVKISNDELPLLKTNIDGVLCVCPNKYFEGFFIAVLKKL